MSLRFQLRSEDPGSDARLGTLETPHGTVPTPAFMPVGTYGAVKGMRAQDLEELGADIVLANTYHLAERPGAELVERLGGLHRFMGWDGPILTDSGGFQVFSLGDLCEVDDDGVSFRSPLDGSTRRLTPEGVVDLQARLGSDIAMVLDECIANPGSRDRAAEALERTQRWAARSAEVADRLPGGLFGIVQGGTHEDLRRRHARELVGVGFDGYAIGGLAVGEHKETTWRMLEATAEELPAERPRYLMGMGTPADLLEGVRRGVDLFDCVLPTRHARNGEAFTSRGRISVKRSEYADDPEPLDPDCGCPTCARYSRGYLRHLTVRGEMLSGILLTWHNLYRYLDTMGRIRQAIADGSLDRLSVETA